MHSLIIGQTNTGKSSLAKKIITEHINKGGQAVVCSPIREFDERAIYFNDINDFTDYIFRNKSLLCVVDESGEMLGRYSGQLSKIATRSRHFGHKVLFIVQRATMLDLSIRSQCTDFYVFRICKKDCEIIDDEAVANGFFLDCHNLQQGSFKYQKNNIQGVAKLW